MSSAVVTLIAETGEHMRELPMPAIAYFFIAFSLFLVALGATWAFKGTAYKHQQFRQSNHGVDEHGNAIVHHGHGASGEHR